MPAFLCRKIESGVYFGRDYTGMFDRMIMNMRRYIAGTVGAITFRLSWEDKFLIR